MRILHTADWHLGSRLHGHDRTDELFSQVERVCQLAEEHQVDTLLVVGDIFDRRGRVLAELTKRLASLLAPGVQRGMHVILVPGNHDDREHFRMMHALLTLEHGHSDRVHVVQTRDILTINGVQFAVIPYPIPELLEPYRQEARGATQRHMVLSTAYATLVRSVVDALDPKVPAIFVAHITVAGVTTPSDREVTYDEDIRLGTEDLPLASNLAYIALGHIHQPQQIRHPVPCYYSGSIDRLNMGEREDDKCVLLVDISHTGPATVVPLPLKPVPFYDIRISAAELETLPERYPALERAFVHVHVECGAGDDPVMLQRRIRELCPRCLDVRISGEGISPAIADLPTRPRDYVETVLGYLRELYPDDPDLPELEKRAKELLDEVNHAFAKD